MLRWIRKRMQSNSGDSFLVVSLLVLPIVLMFMTLAIDQSKSMYVKDQRSQAAEQAAKAGISHGLGSSGGITKWEDFVPAVVNSYMNQRDGKYSGATSEGASFSGDQRCASYPKKNTPLYNDDVPYFKITLSSGRGEADSGGFTGVNNRKAINGDPSIEFTAVEIGYGQNVSEAQVKQWIRSSFGTSAPIPSNAKYNSITLEVMDFATALGFSPTTFMNGNGGCQYFHVKGTAISFGTTGDVTDEIQVSSPPRSTLIPTLRPTTRPPLPTAPTTTPTPTPTSTPKPTLTPVPTTAPEPSCATKYCIIDPGDD